MPRRAVVGEFQDIRLDAFADEDICETQALVLKPPVSWLAVGKYDFFSELCHFDQVLVILWADRVFDGPQAFFVSSTVREGIANVDAAVTPRPRKPLTFRYAAIVHF